MAHYAYLDENNVVVTVIVGKDETELIDGLDPEEYYALNTPYTVKRTSYNGNIRKRFAGVGMVYDEEIDAFIDPACSHGCKLDKNLGLWECQKNDENNVEESEA